MSGKLIATLPMGTIAAARTDACACVCVCVSCVCVCVCVRFLSDSRARVSWWRGCTSMSLPSVRRAGSTRFVTFAFSMYVVYASAIHTYPQ